MAVASMRAARAPSIYIHFTTDSTNQYLKSNILLRHASTSAQPKSKLSPKELMSHGRKTPLPHKTTAVNPPTSTLPPPLESPVRQTDQTAVKHYFSVGRAYLGFYKTAFSNIYSNMKASRELSGRLPSGVSFEAAAQSGLLTRAEYQMVYRSRYDIRKIPLFALLFAICGEFTPFVVVFVPGIVPRAAWVPKQVEKARSKEEARRKESFQQGTLKEDESIKTVEFERKSLKDSNPQQIVHMSKSLNLHSSLWERLWNRPPIWIAKSRVERQIKYLEADDIALDRDGGVSHLSFEEVKIACVERGLDVLGQGEGTLRERLQSWIELRIKQKVGIPALVLIRPGQWKELPAAKK
jgi:hypothetical protein